MELLKMRALDWRGIILSQGCMVSDRSSYLPICDLTKAALVCNGNGIVEILLPWSLKFNGGNANHLKTYFDRWYKVIVAKGVKISTDQFSPQKIAPKKCLFFACFHVFSPVFACFCLFFACFFQKLAPARKNSTDWSARSARFCNSVFFYEKPT